MRIKKLLNEKKSSQGVWRIRLVMILAGLTSIMQIINAVSTLSYGSEITEIDSKTATINKNLNDLERELMQKSSLSKLAPVASEMGFGTHENMLYINGGTASAQLIN